jgi:hypothetical protein
MKRKSKKTLIIFFMLIIFFVVLFFFIFNHFSDYKAYQAVIATMSMEKAKRFFHEHSNSHYKDMLVNEIIEWCNQEKTEECYRIILDAIPRDHPRFEQLSNYYHEHFNVQR